MKKKQSLIIIIFIVLLIGITSQAFFFYLDDKANEQFATKAKDLELVGKGKDFVLNNFGKPVYEYSSDNRLIWVYTPGPALVFWRHECKIGFGMNGLVDGWGVRSD